MVYVDVHAEEGAEWCLPAVYIKVYNSRKNSYLSVIASAFGEPGHQTLEPPSPWRNVCDRRGGRRSLARAMSRRIGGHRIRAMPMSARFESVAISS